MNLADPVILLCGGKSSRMGSPKGLIRTHHRFWIEEQLAAVSTALGGEARVVAVFGHDVQAYRSALAWFDEALEATESGGARVTQIGGALVEGALIRAVINPKPERGPFSSLMTAVELILRDPDLSQAHHAWILPIDVPCPLPGTWSALAAAIQTAQAAVPVYGGHGGHPALLSTSFLRKLKALPIEAADSRLDLQLHKLGQAVARIGVDDGRVLENRNQPQDWG